VFLLTIFFHCIIFAVHVFPCIFIHSLICLIEVNKLWEKNRDICLCPLLC
jgi:hypothetical protein